MAEWLFLAAVQFCEYSLTGNCVEAVDGHRSASKQKLRLLVTNSLDQISAKAVDDNCDPDSYFFPRCIQSLRTSKISPEKLKMCEF